MRASKKAETITEQLACGTQRAHESQRGSHPCNRSSLLSPPSSMRAIWSIGLGLLLCAAGAFGQNLDELQKQIDKKRGASSPAVRVADHPVAGKRFAFRGPEKRVVDLAFSTGTWFALGVRCRWEAKISTEVSFDNQMRTATRTVSWEESARKTYLFVANSNSPAFSQFRSLREVEPSELPLTSIMSHKSEDRSFQNLQKKLADGSFENFVRTSCEYQSDKFRDVGDVLSDDRALVKVKWTEVEGSNVGDSIEREYEVVGGGAFLRNMVCRDKLTSSYGRWGLSKGHCFPRLFSKQN